MNNWNETLPDLAKLYKSLETRSETARLALRESMKDAFHEGVGLSQIAVLCGVSRQRVFQVVHKKETR